MNYTELSSLAETIFESRLVALEFFARIATLGAIVLIALTLAGIVYLCLTDLTTRSKPRGEQPATSSSAEREPLSGRYAQNESFSQASTKQSLVWHLWPF